MLTGHRASARIVRDILVATVALHHDKHEWGEASGAGCVDVEIFAVLLFVTEEEVVDSSGVSEGLVVGRVPLTGVTDHLVATAINGYVLHASATVGQHFSLLRSLLHVIVRIRTSGVGV